MPFIAILGIDSVAQWAYMSPTAVHGLLFGDENLEFGALAEFRCTAAPGTG